MTRQEEIKLEKHLFECLKDYPYFEGIEEIRGTGLGKNDDGKYVVKILCETIEDGEKLLRRENFPKSLRCELNDHWCGNCCSVMQLPVVIVYGTLMPEFNV